MSKCLLQVPSIFEFIYIGDTDKLSLERPFDIARDPSTEEIVSDPFVIGIFWCSLWDQVSYIPTPRGYGNNQNWNEYNCNGATNKLAK